MTVRHVYGHAPTTDVGSGRIAGKGAEMNQRADRLAADLGAPSRLALTRFQDRAKLVAIAQRMAVRLVDARDRLDDVAPEACNPNVEAGAIQETQSKQWDTDVAPPDERRPYQEQEDAAPACPFQ